MEPNIDGISNNHNWTIDNNNFTVAGTAMATSQNNGAFANGIRITNNTVIATGGFWIGVNTNAPYVFNNDFTATDATVDPSHTNMFIFFDNNVNITLDSNRDHTTLGGGYFSLSIRGTNDSIAVNTNNSFI